MSQEMEAILRKSLDDVDRIKKRQTLSFTILMEMRDLQEHCRLLA